MRREVLNLSSSVRAGNAVILRVQAFANEYRLDIYKKAQFGNRIKWALREAGYPNRLWRDVHAPSDDRLGRPGSATGSPENIMRGTVRGMA